MPEEAISWNLTTFAILCPHLDLLARHLPRKVDYVANKGDKLCHIPYRQVIEARGWTDSVTKARPASVEPAVQGLKDRAVTCKVCQACTSTFTLKNTNKSVCKSYSRLTSSGCVSFITGDQDPKHLQFYVSQPDNHRWRIQQHIHAIHDGDQSSLHHNIIANYEDHRVAVCIQLWSLTFSEGINDTRKANYLLRTTILTLLIRKTLAEIIEHEKEGSS